MNRIPIGIFLLLLLTFPSDTTGQSNGNKAQFPWLYLLLNGGYWLSGDIGIAEGLVVDNDVNDPYGQNGPPNDPRNHDNCPLPGQPQDVPNPITIAGYVNRPNTGPSGYSYSSGDHDDYYRVDLKAGQVITLSIAEPEVGDIDLDLFDGSCTTLIDSSKGTNNTEQITVPSDGEYLIDVYPYSGASNYTLSIGQATGGSMSGGMTLRSDFIPGEAIVALKENQALPASSAFTADAIASMYRMSAKAGSPDRHMLWSFELNSNTLLSNQAQSGEATPPASRRDMVAPELRGKYDTLQLIKTLNKQPGVKYAEPNYIFTPAKVPNDTHYPLQWHYPLINLPQAWDVTTGSTAGNDIIVAVVDTGVLLSHPDMQGQLVSGYDFIADPTRARDGNGLDPNPDDPGDRAGSSSSFHGTHVAGTIAAVTNNSSGVAGVAWGAKIMPLRVLGLNGGTSYDIGQANLWAARLPNDSGTLPSQRADVVNMSIQGYGSFSQADQNVYTQVRNAGVIIIACSGNRNEYTASYPGSYNGVVSVGAIDMLKNRAPYSNFHSTVDVAAPGGDTTVDRNGDGYADGVLSVGGDDSSGSIQMTFPFMQGTSMASPHMAGVVALMEAAASQASSPYDLSPAQLDAFLISGAITEDIGTAGRDDQYGYGLIDASKAVLQARGTSEPTPSLSVTPTSLNFGTSTTNGTIEARNSGGGSLSVTGVTDDAVWLTVVGSGLGTYTATVNRQGLAAGTYIASIRFTSDANNVDVPVIMSVASSSTTVSDNAGYHYMLLIDADEADINKQVKFQYDTSVKNGIYPYQLKAMNKSGRYVILAGTDFDNDGYICDRGEACGAFITMEERTVIEPNSNLDELDFTTSFLLQLSTASEAENDGTMAEVNGWPLLTKKKGNAGTLEGK